MQHAICCWKAVVEHCPCRWHRELTSTVLLLRDLAWLLVRNRYSPPFPILFEARAFSCQAVVESAAANGP